MLTDLSPVKLAHSGGGWDWVFFCALERGLRNQKAIMHDVLPTWASLHKYSDQAQQGDFPQRLILAIGLAEVNLPFCLSLKEQLLHLLGRLRQCGKIKHLLFLYAYIISTHGSLCQREGWIYLDPSIAGGCQTGSLRKHRDGMFFQSTALMIYHAETDIILHLFYTPMFKNNTWATYKSARHTAHTCAHILGWKIREVNMTHRKF